MQLSYQNKLFALLATVFLFISIILTYTLYNTLSEQNLKVIEKQLSFTSQLIDDQLDEKTEDVIYYSLQSNDIDRFVEHYQSAPENRLAELHALAGVYRAERALLIAPELAVTLDTNVQHMRIEHFPHPDLQTVKDIAKPRQVILPLNGQIYHWVLFPIQVAQKLHWLALGFEVEKLLRHDLKNISPLDIHLSFAFSIGDHQWHFSEDDFRLLRYDFNQKLQQQLDRMYNESLPRFSMRFGNHVIFMLPMLEQTAGADIVAILIYSFSDSFAAYRQLIIQVLILFAGAFILLSIGTVLIGAKYRNKLIEIVNFIEKVDQGDYLRRLPNLGKGVIGELSAFLNSMVHKMYLREKELLHKTRFDSVTELPNKSYFIEHLSKIIQGNLAKQFAVVLITIDRFAKINHALGHRVADRLLHHVGARITGAFQDANFIGKLSGNSFALILTDIAASEADQISDRIHDLFENPFSVYTVTIDLNAHIGFSFFPIDGDESDILIQKADVALFLAQSKAEHFAVYHPDQDPHQFNKLSLMSELKEGLQNDELVIYYQPKINFATERVTQVEALVRWFHPYKGFMPPNLFIPLAEETGHIKRITYWLLKKTFAQCAAWEAANVPLKISINFSVKDLLNRNLFSNITGLLEVYPIDPRNIMFEITESAFMQDPDNALEAIKKLRELGFTFTIDDFGTGYSSMSYLKRLPVSEMKIDKSFIQDIAHNAMDSQIVRSTIELGHSLNLVVVAEGIEDEHAYELLKSFECDIGQGYYMGKPMALDELEAWLRTSPWGL